MSFPGSSPLLPRASDCFFHMAYLGVEGGTLHGSAT